MLKLIRLSDGCYVPIPGFESSNLSTVKLQAVPFMIVEMSREIAERKKLEQKREGGLVSAPSRLTRKGLLAV